MLINIINSILLSLAIIGLPSNFNSPFSTKTKNEPKNQSEILQPIRFLRINL